MNARLHTKQKRAKSNVYMFNNTCTNTHGQHTYERTRAHETERYEAECVHVQQYMYKRTWPTYI